MSFLGGLQAGVEFGNRQDIHRTNQDIAGQRIQTQAVRNAAGAQGVEEKRLESFKELMGSTAAYVRQLPPDPQQRALGAKSYMQINGADPEMISRIEQSGYLNDLSDQKLDAFSASLREETVLKDKEVLLGRNGQPIYENRYNAPQVVADGSALVGDDGQALYENEGSKWRSFRVTRLGQPKN